MKQASTSARWFHRDRPGGKKIILCRHCLRPNNQATAGSGCFKTIPKFHTRKAFPGVPLSWAYTSKIIRRKLAREGIACETVHKGTAEYDNIVDIWLDHLEESFSRLE
ncbi:MAG: hypothetical protein K9K64_05465 [Desulfohalobiaceae bacterium]|nr:hypothetical protein [Desulfohalobiaceae bacterium]